MSNLKTCLVPQWSLCETCNGSVESKVEMSVGDKVNFTNVTSRGGSISFTAALGKIDKIGTEKIAIMYRKKVSVHNISDITHPKSKNGLTVSMTHTCLCAGGSDE